MNELSNQAKQGNVVQFTINLVKKCDISGTKVISSKNIISNPNQGKAALIAHPILRFLIPAITNRFKPTGGVIISYFHIYHHDDAQMNRVDAQTGSNRKQNRRKNQEYPHSRCPRLDFLALGAVIMAPKRQIHNANHATMRQDQPTSGFRPVDCARRS